ncbi:hypothetical protein ACF3N7_05390 [Cruoricaptor ignavus]|uniref:hypothetical protein n=1 Tax=Cruoricaptor ignavus TaxID=1118202 RepID=UPI00370D9658
MKSTYGIRGQLCHHFSWTYNYLLWQIDWRIVQRMLIDAPDFGMDDEGSTDEIIDLREESLEDFEAKLNNIFG